MNRQRLINAAMDTVTRFLASRFPLKNVVSDVIAARKLNSTERPILFDLVFSWSREIFLLERFFLEKVRFASGFTTQERNALALEIIACDILPSSDDVINLRKDFYEWRDSLGDDRYLFALSSVVREQLIADYGLQAAAVATGLLSRPAKYFAIDRRRLTTERAFLELKDLGLKPFRHQILPHAIGTREKLNLKNLPSHIRDDVWLMDAGSQIIATLIQPKPYERVLDLCAGEGNKLRYMNMVDAHYVAVDIDTARLSVASDRLSQSNIEFIVADGRDNIFSPSSFDWILLDAPCTGVGVLRRHPDLLHRIFQQSQSKLLELQKELLVNAVNLLKPGGKIIYATCSLFRAENERQIERLIKKNKKVIPVMLRELVGEQLKLSEHTLSNYCLTLFPHIDDCDGFFVAALKKVAS